MQYQIFKEIVSKVSLQKYVEDLLKDDGSLKNLYENIRNSVGVLQSLIEHDSKQQKNFFRNYETIISIVYQQFESQAINLSLHWMNLYGQRLIEIHKLKEAKGILQNMLSFTETQKIDKALLSTGLNNLSIIYKSERKYNKSLEYSLQNIQLLVDELKLNSKSKDPIVKQSLFNYAIILVNNCKNSKDCLQKILEKQQSTKTQRKQKNQMTTNLNNLGYQCCKTYLGKNSFFAKFFTPIQKQKSHQAIQKNHQTINLKRSQFQSFQSYMMERLDNIQKMITQKSSTIIGQKSVQFNQISQNQQEQDQGQLQEYKQSHQFNQIQIIPQNVQMPQKNDKNLIVILIESISTYRKVDQLIFIYKQWEVKMQLYKRFANKFGMINISYKHNNTQTGQQMRLSSQKVQILFHLLNTQDFLPYQYHIDDLPNNMILPVLAKYFQINNEGKCQVFNRFQAIQNMETQFLGYKCNIGCYHIKSNKFRIAISPFEQSGTLYLNLDMKQQTVHKLFQHLIGAGNITIKQLYINQLKQSSSKNIPSPEPAQTRIQVKDSKSLQTYIKTILIKFEQFLKDDQQCFSNLSSCIENDETFFKFTEQAFVKGTFFKVHYLKSLKQFCILAENSYIPQSKHNYKSKKARGNAIFSQFQFKQVFGIELSYHTLKYNIKKLQEIICEKYYLVEGKNTNDIVVGQSYHSSNYSDNQIKQICFNFHCFKVHFTKIDNYLSPITASILTLNNQIPIGLKITQYNPYNSTNKGYFIHISPEDWIYHNFHIQNQGIIKFVSLKNSTQNKKPEMFNQIQEKYSFKIDYFIGYWMENQGFTKLLQKVIDTHSKLYIEKNMNQFVNSSCLFES